MKHDQTQPATTITPEEAVVELHHMLAVAEGADIESQHYRGDEVLCAVLRHLGHSAVVEAFEAAKVNWWYA